SSHLSLSVLLALSSPDPPTPLPYTLSLHDALPICDQRVVPLVQDGPSGLDVIAVEPHHELLRGGVTEQVESPDDALGDLVAGGRSEEHTSELQSRFDLVCRLLLEKKKSVIIGSWRR